MMVPILLGSVMALTIIIERLWSLQRKRILPQGFLRRIERMVGEGKRSEALTACRENDSAIARVLGVGLDVADRPRPEIQEALQMAGRHEAGEMNRWVGALGAISALEPLMGLLGTVLGLIESFRDVEKLKVVGNPSVVAAGVWQALITTAAGLMIAIPTYIMYRYFRSHINSLVMDMERVTFGILQKITVQRSGPGGSET